MNNHIEDYKILKGKSDRELGILVRAFFEKYTDYTPLGAPFTTKDEWGCYIWHQAVIKYHEPEEKFSTEGRGWKG